MMRQGECHSDGCCRSSCHLPTNHMRPSCLSAFTSSASTTAHASYNRPERTTNQVLPGNSKNDHGCGSTTLGSRHLFCIQAGNHVQLDYASGFSVPNLEILHSAFSKYLEIHQFIGFHSYLPSSTFPTI